MGQHQAVTIITRPPGYRGGIRPLRVLTYSTFAAMCAGMLVGFALFVVLHLAATSLWPWETPAPVPCPQIIPLSPLDNQWNGN